MTAKEKQVQFIESYLKPTLKQFGYRVSGQTWWKDKGEFFNVINLQNFSWNSKNSVDFCFNVGIAVKALVKDSKKQKATYNDLVVHIREDAFIPSPKARKFGNGTGYSIIDNTDLEAFTLALKDDFEGYLLPKLESPTSLSDCLTLYEPFEFWHNNLKRVIAENHISLTP